VPVVEGESERPEFCVSLGKCVVRDLPPDLPKGTPVEVTYRYALNGRVSVSARVPSTGRSAEVEIERDRGHINADLPTWRNRLLKAAPPPLGGHISSENTDETDLATRDGIIRQLDTLYTQIGQAAVAAHLPKGHEAAQRAARTAAEELRRARQALAEAEQRRAETHGPAEAARLSAEVSNARLSERQAATNSRFAYLSLGREIATAGLSPLGAEEALKQAQSLRRQLK
jgi:molecular chaperone DnaK (HSP70)